MKRIISLTLLLAGSILLPEVSAQPLEKSRKNSEYTYIYKLNQEEARKLYRKKWEVDDSYFHTLVDSFPTDSSYSGELPTGHYLKTLANRNQQQISIISIHPFDVYVIDNHTDLIVRIYNRLGETINDVTVRADNKQLRFDTDIQAFRHKKSNKRGMLEVTHNGFTAYYNLSRKWNNPGIKRATNKALYNTPLKAVWLPVRYVVHLPVDGVKSIVKGYTTGTVSSTGRFFRRFGYKVGSWFGPKQGNSYYSNSGKYTSYMVFSQPKYKPGDTVKFKAFVVNKRGKPVEKPADVAIFSKGKIKKISTLSPYESGGYSYSFTLHDSLQLSLDQYCNVYLRFENGTENIYGTFRYELYELSGTKLVLRQPEATHYTGKFFTVYARGTNENGLNLQDARLEIKVIPDVVKQYLANQLVIPDVLYHTWEQLEPKGETELIIPDTIFPLADMDYQLQVRLLTSDNDAVREILTIPFRRTPEDAEFKLSNDSIYIAYTILGEKQTCQGVVKARDHFGNESLLYSGTLPCRFPLEPYHNYYSIQVDDFSKSFDMNKEAALIQCYTERTMDSLRIEISNPRQLPFTYTLFKRNKLKQKGYTDSLSIKYSLNTKENYYLSLSYLWGGKMQEKTYSIPLYDKKLNLSVNQPDLIYPGQQVRIEVEVTDAVGRPVEDVDVTAFGMTRKFNYSPATVPYLGKLRKNKRIINQFRVNKDLRKLLSTDLDYETWKLFAGLDTIEYYQFLYPEKGIYRYTCKPPKPLTQFAPFVVYQGNPEEVHVIYLDNKPVYMSWATTYQPYSFPATPGYHQLKLRTATHLITLDSLYLVSGKKTILSIDRGKNVPRLRVELQKRELSSQELDILRRYMLFYRKNLGNELVHLEQKDQIIPLNYFNQRDNSSRARSSTHGRGLVAPVSGSFTVNQGKDFSRFLNFEPCFEYDFNTHWVMLRTVEDNITPSSFRFNSYSLPSFEDWVLTRDRLEEMWQATVNQQRYQSMRYNNPDETSPEHGRLQISPARSHTDDAPLNVLLFRYDDADFLRVYSGSTTIFHDLPEAHYRVILFYAASRYQVIDFVRIHPNALSFFRYDPANTLPADEFSLNISKIIEDNVFKSAGRQYTDGEKQNISSIYRGSYNHQGEGDLVEGFIYDDMNEPLPGVTVTVAGYSIGTATDINGYYRLLVPPIANPILNVSYIGMQNQEIAVGNRSHINVTLEASEQAMDEVIVTGFSETATTNRSVVLSDDAFPFVKGEDTAQLFVRGVGSSVSNNIPLIVINGEIFTGDPSSLNSDLFSSVNVLKEASATALYGSRAANGVVIIQTGEDGVFAAGDQRDNKGADYDDLFAEAAFQHSSIRNNFSDAAFWQPRLRTDASGKAAFETVFPDDVTSWETFFIAMNGKRQSGQTQRQIKSYKPLMAQLSIPRFLIQGDTTALIGKALNYSPVPMGVTTHFSENNGEERKLSYETIENALVDTIPLVANCDSLRVKYWLQREEDGYFDGEEREIPIYPVGLEEAVGQFIILDRDTTIRLSADPTLGEVTLYAQAQELDILEDEIRHVAVYKYDCNEQLASKLMALLTWEHIAQLKGEHFDRKKEINRIIKLLNERRNRDFWGWWQDTPTNYWMSVHIVEALVKAEVAGYTTMLNRGELQSNIVWKLEDHHLSLYDRICLLRIGKQLDLSLDYKRYLSALKSDHSPNFIENLQILLLQQACGLSYNMDTLSAYRRTSLMGNIYYMSSKENDEDLNIYRNDIQSTLMVYQLIRNGKNPDTESLRKMRNWLLEKRGKGHWRNTYESARIIETLLPDLLNGKKQLSKSILTLDGDRKERIEKFPFEMTLSPSSELKISSSGDAAIYLTTHQQSWNIHPERRDDKFEITTTLDGRKDSLVLTAGQEAELVVQVAVKENTEFVTIHIPVPGSCSYLEKHQRHYGESHREYYENEVTIFCERFTQGLHTFTVKLLPRFSGTYILNPAQVELMYFPTIRGNDEIKKVRVKF